MTNKANTRQVGGKHYSQSAGLQHWDIVALFNLDYFQGYSTKYIFRWRDKGGIQDLEKSVHVLEKYIELEKARAAGTLTMDLLRSAMMTVADLEVEEQAEEDERRAGERAKFLSEQEAELEKAYAVHGDDSPVLVSDCETLGRERDEAMRREEIRKMAETNAERLRNAWKKDIANSGGPSAIKEELGCRAKGSALPGADIPLPMDGPHAGEHDGTGTALSPVRWDDSHLP